MIGHRGASTEAPENTVRSFVRSLDLGADGFEFDVQLTEDGEAVVIHDATLERTTTGSGAVCGASIEQVRRLDAGSWFSGGFVGEQVPTLDEVLALPAAVFELELKTQGRLAIETVLTAVDRAAVLDRVKFTSSDRALLRYLKNERPEATIGLFAQRPQPWMTVATFERHILGTAETASFDVAHVYARAITEPIVLGLAELGYRVHANDAIGADDINRAIDAGADSISLNDVALGVSLRR